MPPPNRVNDSRNTDIFTHRETPKMASVALGVVTSSTDPANRGRVQVSLPWLGSTMWAPAVSVPGSASSAGYQTGDEVVVGFDHGDPSLPIVLGRVGS